MKHPGTLKALLVVALPLGLASACSSMGGTSSQELAQTGPTIIDSKAVPGTFELNKREQPMAESQVVAEIKDFRNNVSDVKLRFRNVPIEKSMKQTSSSVWVATFTPKELQKLGVAGHTMNYEADVIAKNDKGQIAVGKTPVEIKVKAPETVTG